MAATCILRHSRWDTVLIALSLIHGAVLLCAPSVPVIAIGLWWNANTISHNFLHLPFFKLRTMNRFFNLYLTLLLGIPQSIWRERHLAHHSGRVQKILLTRLILGEMGLVLALWV